MKTLLILLLTSAFAFGAVEITDDARVLIDGADVGDVTSSAKNNLVPLRDLQLAVLAKLTKLKTDAAAALTAEQEKCAAIIAKLNDPASTKGDVKVEADKTDSARRREALLADKAALDAQAAAKQVEIDALEALKAEALKSRAVKKPVK